MKLLIIFAILAFTRARIIERTCDDVIVRNIHHEQNILVDNTVRPYQLVIDYDTNILFFSYYVKSNYDMFKSAYLNLKTSEFHNITGIFGGFANAVDKKKHIGYLGGTDGLYKFDFDSKTAKHVDGIYDTIWQMFFKNELYYSIFPYEEIYEFKNGQSKRLPELAHTKALLVALNNNGDFYFTNSSGLFKQLKSNHELLHLGDYIANSLTADNNGNLYFSTSAGIYYINENDKVDEVVMIPNIYGVAIESDGNIIYASQNSIVRLKPTKTPCYVNDKKNNDEKNNL